MGKNKIIVEVDFDAGQAQKQVTGLTASLSKLNTERSDLRKQLKLLQKDEEANSKKIAEVSEALNRNERQTKKTRDSIRLLNRSLDAGSGSLNDNRALLLRLNKSYDSFRVGIDGTEKDLKKLGERVKSVSDEVKEQEESTGRAQRSVGDYGKALREAFSGDFSGLGTLKNDLAGLGTLLSNPATLIAGAGAAAVVATAQFAQYTKGLERDRQEVEQLTGATGELSNKLAGSARALENTFGTDREDSLKAINTLTAELGGNLDTNFGRLNTIAASTGSNFGEVLEITKEYSAQFRGLNVSAEEFLSIATQTVKEGFFNDSGVDTIKEAIIRVREMTPATREALDAIGISADDIQKRVQAGTTTLFEEVQGISATMAELNEQSPEYGKGLADIFAGPGEVSGPRFFEVLSSINTEFGALESSLTEAQVRQIELAEANETIEQTFNQLFASSGEFFLNAEVGAKKLLAEGLVKLVEGVDLLVNYFIDLYNGSIAVRGAFNGVSAVIKSGFDIAIASVSQFLNIFQTVGSVVKAVLTGEFSSISDIIGDGFSDSANIAKDAGAKVAENFTSAADDTFKRKPIKPFSLLSSSGEAKKEGEKAAESFNEGFSKKAKTSLAGARGPEAENRKKAEKEAETKRIKNDKARLKRELLDRKLSADRKIELEIKLLQTERDLKLQSDKLLSEERLLIEAETQQKINKLSEERLIQIKSEADAQLNEYNRIQKAKADQLAQDQIRAEEDKIAREEEVGNALQLAESQLSAAQELGAFFTEEANRRADIRIAEIEANENLSESEKAAAIATAEAERERSGAYKAGRAIQKAAAIAELGINLGRQLSSIATTSAQISGAFPPISVPLGIAYGVTNAALALAQSGRRIADIRALEEGGPTGIGGGMTSISIGPGGQITHNGLPVGRDDGLLKRGGFVNTPTLSVLPSGKPAILGENKRAEYVINNDMLKLPSVMSFVSQLEKGRVRGFDVGGSTSVRIPSFQSGGFDARALSGQGFSTEEIKAIIRESVAASPPIYTNVTDVKNGLDNKAQVEEFGNI